MFRERRDYSNRVLPTSTPDRTEACAGNQRRRTTVTFPMFECTFARTIILAVLLLLMFYPPAKAHEIADPTIKRNARDGIVKLYGAGGPDTAFKKVAEVFHAETGIRVEITGGPESAWSKKAQADADILWGTAEEDITAMLETYKDFAWKNVKTSPGKM